MLRWAPMVHALVTLAAALVVTQLAILLTTVYLHRTLAHRAMTVTAPVSLTMRAILWMTTGIKPRQWVAVHRKHHAFTDVEGDPHSPVMLGFAPVQFNNVGLYRKALRNPNLVARYAKDLAPDRWDKVLFDRAWLGLGVGITLLCVALGWKLGLVAAVLHTAVYLLLNAAINAVGHTYGRQPNPNTSRNNQWLAWLTAGEGLHNNHHAAPTSARFALAKGEIDPGWWLVRALEKTGLARVRHHDVKLKVSAAA
jgi:stearoyl-CoA desaturase (delta-9 desaturase)